jgi:hypothetical protein
LEDFEMRDLKDNIVVDSVLDLGTYKTTQTSDPIDLQGFDSAMIQLLVGTLTDGTFAPKLQECDTSGGTYADVAADEVVGAFANLASSTDQKVSYVGSKRYLKLVVTVTGSPSTGCALAAVLVKGHPHKAAV